MLVVLSDLHFQEDPHLKDRNLEPKAFRILFEQLARVARAKESSELIVVLNGDIFDHMRNPRWLVPDAEGFEVRPYAECDVREGQTLPETADQRAWEIHQAIEADPRVKPCVDLLAAMGNGTDDIFGSGLRPRFLYIPGTSDRLANLSPMINARIREILGLSAAETDGPLKLFPNQLLFSAGLPEDYPRAETELGLETGSLDYALLVQHGHEYDWLSCEFNHDENLMGRALTPEDHHLYALSPLSDWMAIDVIQALAHRFLEECGGDVDALIEGNQFIYRCLTDADDIRPQIRVLQWLMWRLDGDPWRQARHLVRGLIEDARQHPRLKRWLTRRDRRWLPDRSDKISAALGTLGRLGDLVPDSVLARLARRMTLRSWPDVGPDGLIREDPIWQWDDIHFLCFGHYHDPSNRTLGIVNGHPKMAVGTGTWRRRHQLCLDEVSHVTVRSLNYAIFYRPEETPGADAHRAEVWTGQTLTQRPEPTVEMENGPADESAADGPADESPAEAETP